MVYAVALLGNLLLASAALATPSRLDARLARRREGRQSHPMQTSESLESFRTNNSNALEYSLNWAGAVWDSYPSGTFKSVTGTFVVPTPQAVSGSSTGSASAWVGIDGDTCDTAILQTGVDFTVTDGVVSFEGWYEWYPDYAYDFSSLTIHSGDTITLTVTASTTKTGTAVIENKTTGQTVTESITSASALCEENAEWIVEDYEQGGALVKFANFGTVTFTNAEATTSSGSTIGPSGSTTIDMEQNSEVVTSVSTSSSGVVIEYV